MPRDTFCLLFVHSGIVDGTVSVGGGMLDRAERGSWIVSPWHLKRSRPEVPFSSLTEIESETCGHQKKGKENWNVLENCICSPQSMQDLQDTQCVFFRITSQGLRWIIDIHLKVIDYSLIWFIVLLIHVYMISEMPEAIVRLLYLLLSVIIHH